MVLSGKRKMRSAVLFVVLFAGWLMLSGHYTPLLVTLGVVSCAFATFMAYRIDAIDDDALPLHLALRLPGYLAWLFKEIIKSNIATAKIILTGNYKPEIFEVRASQNSDVAMVTYANSITLTPGTVTVEVVGDDDRSLIVHALHSDFADDVRSGEMDRRCCELERGAA